MKFPYLKLFLAAVIWGGALVAGRVISAELPPFTITLVRFTLVSFFLLPVLCLQNRSLPKLSGKSFLLLAVISVSGVVLFNYLMFSGLRTVTAVRGSVYIAFIPMVVALVSGLFFKESLTVPKVLGFLLAFFGAVVTITNGDPAALFSQAPAAGDLFFLGCVFAWTVYSLATKYALQYLSPLVILTYASVLGSLLLVPPALAEKSLRLLVSQPPMVWFCLVYVSLGAAGIAYLWYYQGVKAVGVSRATIFINLEPPAAIVLGILLLGESLSPSLFLGVILVLSGLFLTGYRSSRSASLSRSLTSVSSDSKSSDS
ncbi:MAG: DMT family transporter [Spirochaetales bacterium]|nr:DMT family transporter [Spirochaetales bacterium]